MAKKDVDPTDAPDTADTVRLHITPLTSATASSILPADTDLSTISYHTLPSFPEASYGFVDLPTDAANKLKKKLHGAMFRGVKVRVEEARAEVWKTRVGTGEDGEEKARHKKRKRAREEGVLEGFEIGDRSVVRGWVEKVDRGKDGEKKKRKERGECLFKVVIPPNKAGNDTKREKKAEKKERKDKEKKKLVKEFEHLEKFPQFLKISHLDPTKGKESLATEFVEGVGWVDAKGEVVEAPPKKKEKKHKKAKEDKKEKGEEVPAPVLEETAKPGVADIAEDIEPVAKAMDIDDNVSVSSEEVFFDIPEEKEGEAEVIVKEAEPTAADVTAESEDDSDDEEILEVENDSKASTSKPVEPEPESEANSDSSSDESGDEKLAPAKAPSTPAKGKQAMSHTSLPPLAIHPLEALYKPAAFDATDAETSAPEASASTFRFGFGGSADSDDEDDTAPVTTPYRDPGRYRSSAPTPDTAIGTKRFFSPTSNSDGSAGEFVPSTPRATSNVNTDAPLLFLHDESRFLKGLSLWQQLPQPSALKSVEEPAQEEEGEAKLITDPVELWKKRFYESRGEWNRDWKRRRKEGLKAKRKRERTGPGGSGANRA